MAKCTSSALHRFPARASRAAPLSVSPSKHEPARSKSLYQFFIDYALVQNNAFE